MQVNLPSKGANELTSLLFKRIIHSGVAKLRENMEILNDLNVFPVPDGDTGTNMYQTLFEACQEMDKVKADRIPPLAATLSKATMMAARGNSGVILSQLMRGFTDILIKEEELTPMGLARAFENAAKVAYKAVIKPVEGTILTVARSVGEGALEGAESGSDLMEVLEAGLKKGEITLEKTPTMLPVLAEAGVVDAGGQGYVFFLQGILESTQKKRYKRLGKNLKVIASQKDRVLFSQDSPLEFVYCTELLIKGKDIPLHTIRQALAPFGDSLMVVGTSDMVKVHIHTNNPGEVLEYGLSFGSLSRININNMEEQKEEHLHSWDQKERSGEEVGVIAVVPGEGLKEIFKGLGTDVVIPGGQGENPSTRDLLEAVSNLRRKKVIILPNNKNIISAAEQVQELSSAKVFVIPSRTIPQGLASLMAYSPKEDIDSVVEGMGEAIRVVKSGEITYAVRASEHSGHQIQKGDVLGLWEGDLKVVTPDCKEGLKKLLEIMVDEGDALITLYRGLEIEKEEALALEEEIKEQFSEQDVEVYHGGQPLYYYYISVE